MHTYLFPVFSLLVQSLKGPCALTLKYHHLTLPRSPTRVCLKASAHTRRLPCSLSPGSRGGSPPSQRTRYLIRPALFIMILRLTTFIYTTKYGVPARQVGHSGFTNNKVDLCMRINNRNVGIPLQIGLNERT